MLKQMLNGDQECQLYNSCQEILNHLGSATPISENRLTMKEYEIEHIWAHTGIDYTIIHHHVLVKTEGNFITLCIQPQDKVLIEKWVIDPRCCTILKG